jgi:ketosteroid isomerase-like protein
VSEENVEIVRRVIEGWEQNDLDAGLALMDDAVEWHPAGHEPETATARGKAAITERLLEWATAFEDFRADALEFIDAGECVVVPFRYAGRVRGSGGEVAIEETNVFRLRDGKIVEVREYRTKDEALAAAGVDQ